MSILINQHTQVLIQGITGKEGSRALKWMKAMGTQVVAGVTPGKGGLKVDDVPVYNSIKEALNSHPQINTTSIYVPPKFVLGAGLEAIEAKLGLIHIISEGVPTKDTAILIQASKKNNLRILGPSSIGMVCPGCCSLGSIGGGNMSQYLAATSLNDSAVAILSKSGGMANTIANMLTTAKIPQSCVIGLGGDRLIGTTYADLLNSLQQDSQTKAVVIIGEIGGSYEENLADKIKEINFTKPIIAFISGIFAETLPQGIAFGHQGAIVSKNTGSRKSKIEALLQAGARVVSSPSKIVDILNKVIKT
jgi:succinyl-CoA synthetase alpha subunit